jgi:transcriptional regulator with XRE-family HTH domain
MQNRIKIMRKKRGLTMRQLAGLMGTSQQQVDRLEKSRRRLTQEWMERLSEALSCEYVDLLPLEGARNAQTTSRAKVIGFVDTAQGNTLQSFTEKDTYMLLFSRCRHVATPKLFGLVVEGRELFGFPQGSELIFTELDGKTGVEAGKIIVAMTTRGQYYVTKTPLSSPKDIIKARLVKSICDE